MFRKIILFLIQKYLDKNSASVIISINDKNVEVEEAIKVIKEHDLEEESEKYMNQYW